MSRCNDRDTEGDNDNSVHVGVFGMGSGLQWSKARFCQMILHCGGSQTALVDAVGACL